LRLLVARPGWRLGLRKGQVEARGPKGEVVRVPLHEVDAIIVATRGASVSSALLAAAADAGIGVYLVDPRGKAAAALAPVDAPRIPDRMLAQARWRLDPRLHARAAAWFAEYKIRARARLMRLLAKTRGSWLRDYSYRVERLAVDARSAESPGEAMLVEAEAGRLYWPAVAEALGLEGFTGRTPRAGDPWNTLLDFAYSLLYPHAHTSLAIAGLNPYLGFLHSDRSGRPSLTLDFVEPYRWAAELAVFRYATRRGPPRLKPDGGLDAETRRGFLEVWTRILDDPPGLKKPLDQVMRLDAWRLAAAIEEEGEWAPTLPRW